jgi:pimeloyl-ACP methyl ester carboxylesterase
VEAQFVETADGRALAWSEVGDPGGSPVVWCHGGLSGRTDASFAARGAQSAGVRLITIDRPGIGDSTRRKGRSVSDWADDVRVVADALGLDHFGVVGWSGGGPHALACTAKLAERVSATATIGGMEPVRTRADRKALGLRADRLLIPIARHAPWLARTALAASTRLSPERQKRVALRGFSAADRRVLEPLPPEAVVGSSIAAAAPGVAGIVDDYRAFGSPDWGFELSDIPGPVRCWQGQEDAAVPPAIGRRLAGAIPRGELELVPDAGHFLVLEHGQDVFTRLVTDASA